MNVILKILDVVADILIRVVGIYDTQKAQESSDRIDADPAAEFMRRFKRP